MHPALAPFPSLRQYRERFSVRSSGRIVLVPVEDVEWIEADKKLVQLHTRERVHTIRETMDHVEQSLDPRVFRRIHRSTIVNLRYVAELQPWFRGDCVVVLRQGVELMMSRTYRSRLRDLFV